VPGKLAYMAPEQMHGVSDRRADVFAAGILLWELITLRRFWGKQSEAAVMRQLLMFDVPHGDGALSGMDDELAAICKRALQADPRERYPSAAEMQSDLERYLVTRSGVVVESTIGQLVQCAFGGQRAHSQQEVRALLAGLDAALIEAPCDTLPDQGERPSRDSLATVATCPLPAGASGGWSRALVALAAAAFIGHVGDTLTPDVGLGSAQAAAQPSAWLGGYERAGHTTAAVARLRPGWGSARPVEAPAPAPVATPSTERVLATVEPARAAASDPAALLRSGVTAPAPTHARAPAVRRAALRPSSLTPPANVSAADVNTEKRPSSAARAAGAAPSVDVEPGSDLRRLRVPSAIEERVSGRWP
jgi:serine/threonine-protein kinase